MPVETVFLDAGGVLMFPNWTRVSDALARHGVHAAPGALARAEPYARRQIDEMKVIGWTDDARRGWMFFDLILARLGVERSEATATALSELHAYHRAHNLWELVPANVKPALTAMRARGLRLGVVSNANGTLGAHMKRLGLDAMVDCVLDSFDEKVEKPDPRIFRIALERTGSTPDTTIHVGDLYHVDVLGARSAGLRAVLLDEADLRPDADCLRIRSLDELVARIEAGEFD